MRSGLGLCTNAPTTFRCRMLCELFALWCFTLTPEGRDVVTYSFMGPATFPLHRLFFSNTETRNYSVRCLFRAV